MVSTTGFSTADFALWPTVSQFVLVLLMFLGGCAGSTAGGLKASRVLLLLRCARRSLRRLSHPRAVKVVKLDGKAVDEETLNTVFVFFTCFFLVLGGTCLVVSLDGFSLTTSCSAALACISNTGPRSGGGGALGQFCRLFFPEQSGALHGHAGGTSGDLPHLDSFPALYLGPELREKEPGIPSL